MILMSWRSGTWFSCSSICMFQNTLSFKCNLFSIVVKNFFFSFYWFKGNSWYLQWNIQIKIAMSKDKLRILIKILAESHMAFDWEIKLTFDCTDRQTSPIQFPPLFKACCMRVLAKHQALGWRMRMKRRKLNRAGLSVCAIECRF